MHKTQKTATLVNRQLSVAVRHKFLILLLLTLGLMFDTVSLQLTSNSDGKNLLEIPAAR